MTKIQELALAMISYNNGDPKRIQHTTKVHAYAALIGMGEHLDEETLFVLESAAQVHDIGIRASEKKYGHQDGKLQEQEGPGVARDLLTRIGGYTEKQIERICWLVGHHHTYHVCEDLDYQILIEADFLVNLFEDNESLDAVRAVRKNIFRTKTGLKLLDDMYFSDKQQPDNLHKELLDRLFMTFKEKGYSAEDFYGGCALCGDANDFALDIIDEAVSAATPNSSKFDRDRMTSSLYSDLHKLFEKEEQ